MSRVKLVALNLMTRPQSLWRSTMLAKQAFSNVVHESLNPDEIFRQVNEIIVNRVETSDYLTCFLLKIDQRNRVIFGSGGHPNAIKYAYKKGIRQMRRKGALALGR